MKGAVGALTGANKRRRVGNESGRGDESDYLSSVELSVTRIPVSVQDINFFYLDSVTSILNNIPQPKAEPFNGHAYIPFGS